MKMMKSFVQVAAIAAVVCAAQVVSITQAQAQNEVTAQVGNPPPPAPKARRRHAPPPPPAMAPAAAPMAPEATIAPPPAPMSPAAEVRHNFNFDAFVDANARVTSRNYLYNAGDLNRGFSIKSGALLLSGDLSKQTRAVVEIPFYTAENATTNGFTIAQGYAQAYAAYTMASVPLTFKMGQYASFFGLEANDSRDRFFTQESMAKTAITPWTHLGLQVGWASEGATKFSVLGQVANSNVAASGNNSVGALADNNVEAGVQGRIDAGMAYGALGVSYSRAQTLAAPQNVTADSNDTNTLIELMGGMNIGSFNWGLQLDSKKSAGFKDTAFAATLLGAYQLNADLALGARLQNLSNTPATVSGSLIEIKNAYGIAVGPSFKLDNNLTIRGDLNYTSIKADGINDGSAKNYFGANFSVVATL